MFLATSLGCIHEVIQFCPALGVVSHIIMSMIHQFSSVKPCKCRDEVSEQKYFTLYQFLEKKVPHLRISYTDSKFRNISYS